MLKVAYISPTYFSNVDIPYLQCMQDLCDIHYFPIVPHNGRGYAVNITNLPTNSGIYCGTDFPELSKFKDIIDLKKTHIVYRKAKKSWYLSNWKISFMLLRTLKQEKFDIIHITDSWRYYEFPLLALSNKTVLSVHDPFLHSSMQNSFAEIYRKISFQKFNYFILFNKSQLNEFISQYHLHNKNVFISQLSVYSYLNAFAKPSYHNERYALFIGTIRAYKGLEYLFEAMDIVHAKYPKYKLIVAGSGTFYFDIEKYKKHKYIEIINRFLTDEEQAPLIANADFIVCPYVDATQSGVIMSAYAFEKPCIVTNTGGLPEMVGNGEYGIIVPTRDVYSLANAICDIISNPHQIDIYSQKIRHEYYEGNHSWKIIANNIYEKVYNKIVRYS